MEPLFVDLAVGVDDQDPLLLRDGLLGLFAFFLFILFDGLALLLLAGLFVAAA